MLIINYFCIIFTVMKFVNSIDCKNDFNCDDLTPVNKSLIILQRFTRAEEKSFPDKERATQTKTLVLSHQYQISISVKVEIDITRWKILSTNEKRTQWLKLRRQLYWSCETSNLIPSLCIISNSMATSVLTIRLSDPHTTTDQHLQCSICFLKDYGTELLHWYRVSHHLKTFAFNPQKYLPLHLTQKQASVLINVTRTDFLPIENDINKIFITNISIADVRKEIDESPDKCKFICGLGPQCLQSVSDICDNRIHCVNGDDEDIRLCNALRKRIFSLDTNSPSPIGDSYEDRPMDSRVMSSLGSYLFVLLGVVLLLILMILFVWFICRSCNMTTCSQYKGCLQTVTTSMATTTTTTATNNTDTSCSTCEQKSRLNVINYQRCAANTRELDDLAYRNQSHPFSIKETETAYCDQRKCYRSVPVKRSQLELRANQKRFKYSNRKEVLETSDWLNLFFRVSREARHKSLVTQPPPNVNNDTYNSNIPEFSTTPSTCVFPVMI